MIRACEKHTSAPAQGYSACPGCEVEGLRDRIAELEREKAELLQELEWRIQEGCQGERSRKLPKWAQRELGLLDERRAAAEIGKAQREG